MTVRSPEYLSRAVPLALDAAGAAPSEFRILAAGNNASVKGVVTMSADAGEMVLSAARAEHADAQLPIDAGHGMYLSLGGVAEDGRAFGWFTPEVRDGELWAARIQWTPAGAAALASREYRYFSPTFMRDSETNEITELLTVSLTNIPALRGIAPLAADAKEVEVTKEKFEALQAERDQLVAASATMSAELGALKTKLAEQEKAAAVLALSAKVDGLIKTGKLAPALKTWALSQTVESLDAYAASAPALPVTSTPVAPPAVASAEGLTAEELEVCRQGNIKPEAFAARKARLAAQEKK